MECGALQLWASYTLTYTYRYINPYLGGLVTL